MSETQQAAETTRDLHAIVGAARKAERRIRFDRALSAGTTALCGGLLVTAIAITLRKTSVLNELTARVTVGVAVVGVVAVAMWAYLRPLAARAGAVALDRFHGLADRLSSALSFGAVAASERTPFMDAAIDDALAHAQGVDPKKAVPIRRPADLPGAAALAVVVVLLLLFEVRRHEPIKRADTIDAVDVTADDLDAMREFLRDQQQKEQNEETKAAIDQFNQLIEDLAAKRLDRTEAFRRMQALEDKLLEGREADAKALEEAMRKIGEQMKKSEMTKPAGEALESKNLVDAEKQLRDLAKKLKEDGRNIDKAKLEKMREALKAAASEHAKRMEALQAKRDELKKQLLEQKQKMGDGGTEQERSLLQKRERELERLDREQQQQEAVGRQLDRLDRELSQAAEDLLKDLGASAKDLEQAAEDINRMAKQEMTQEEKEQLRQKLQELREMLRQQGQGGQGQQVRLVRFQQRARGQSGGDGQQGQGQGQQGQGGEQGQGGRQDQGGQQGQGQGQGGQGGEMWIVGPNGEKIMMISLSKGGSGSGQSQGGQGGQQGKGWGTGAGGNPQGQASSIKSGVQDTQVAGQDTGQGGSRSEVIQGAAERGFASRGYQKVYREYHTVAEEALNKDEIPGGYRFYVRRYFQLIRPRDPQ